MTFVYFWDHSFSISRIF